MCGPSSRWLALGAVLAVACAPAGQAGSSGLPYYTTPDFTARWLTGADAEVAHRIGGFSLTNQAGALVSNAALAGHVYVANFFFASCQAICPKMAANMRRIQTAYRDDPDVVLASHSVDPASDTTASLAEYGRENGVIAGKWHLLTGDQAAIYTLARRSYFAEKSLGMAKSTKEFLHTENMLLIDRHGHIRGIYNATLQTEAERIIGDIGVLLREP